MPIVVRIDVDLSRPKMTAGEFAERVGLTPANVAVLKNGRAKAVRFSTPGGHVPDARLPARRPARMGQGGNPMRYVATILAVALGVGAVVAGGADDSPGL